MIKLKSLLTEETPYDIPWRDWPIIEHILNMVQKLIIESKIDTSTLTKEQYRQLIEKMCKGIYPYRTMGFTSFEAYTDIINKIVDEWFIRRYTRSKSDGNLS